MSLSNAGYGSIIKLLLAKGTDPNITNKKGKPASTFPKKKAKQ